jgi:hypothetical protein
MRQPDIKEDCMLMVVVFFESNFASHGLGQLRMKWTSADRTPYDSSSFGTRAPTIQWNLKSSGAKAPCGFDPRARQWKMKGFLGTKRMKRDQSMG